MYGKETAQILLYFYSLPAGLTIYTDILTSFKKMGDYALNVVEANTDQPKHLK